VAAPRFFSEGDASYCEAGGRVYRIVDAGGQRWFIPVASWDSRFRAAIIENLERVAELFCAMLDDGVPLEDARQILPAGAMMNLEFEDTFGQGDQLPP
jgi:thymidylate synthase ThyX